MQTGSLWQILTSSWNMSARLLAKSVNIKPTSSDSAKISSTSGALRHRKKTAFRRRERERERQRERLADSVGCGGWRGGEGKSVCFYLTVVLGTEAERKKQKRRRGGQWRREEGCGFCFVLLYAFLVPSECPTALRFRGSLPSHSIGWWSFHVSVASVSASCIDLCWVVLCLKASSGSSASHGGAKHAAQCRGLGSPLGLGPKSPKA